MFFISRASVKRFMADTLYKARQEVLSGNSQALGDKLNYWDEVRIAECAFKEIKKANEKAKSFCRIPAACKHGEKYEAFVPGSVLPKVAMIQIEDHFIEAKWSDSLKGYRLQECPHAKGVKR